MTTMAIRSSLKKAEPLIIDFLKQNLSGIYKNPDVLVEVTSVTSQRIEFFVQQIFDAIKSQNNAGFLFFEKKNSTLRLS